MQSRFSQAIVNLFHNVTGEDLSANSLEHARKSAHKKGLEINYLHSNYLDLDLEENSFDLIIMIYCDFGVLIPEDYRKLL
ncbi:MAG: class I SAM-dependent methyltransferase [Spirochaetales bacterium]|nr:class I SAM-dependent methyltransferase [Spirochaetales bacterium]